VTRHLLFDKARDLQQWAAFLAQAGVWTRLASLPGAVAARQRLAEACERVSAAMRLRELHDREPDVFVGAVHRVLQAEDGCRGQPSSPSSPETEAQRYYSCVSTCERLLFSLADYPRSLPLGSSDATDAVIFANCVAVAFLEAALDRRGQLVASFPALLPPPLSERGQRCLAGSVPPPRGVGSSWLVSPKMRQALEALRLVNLEVLPSAPRHGLPLLDSQALRLLESLQELCRSTLRAGHASLCDLQGQQMAQLRQGVLEHLVQAEARIAAPAGTVPGAVLLAEEFEDLETVVRLTVEGDPERLEVHLARSEVFRVRALEQFLRTQALQPHFFSTVQRFEVPEALVEALLAPYPELRWTLEVDGLSEASTEATWQAAMDRVERRAAAMVQRERHSAVKREAFAALAALSRAAAGLGEDTEDTSVEDLACLGRIQRTCHRFGGNGTAPSTVGSKRPSPVGPPASVEDCLQELSEHTDVIVGKLRTEGSEGRFFADAARLVRLVERGLCERGVDLAPLLLCEAGSEAPVHGSGKDGAAARALQRLWAKVVLADEERWQEVLIAPEGPVRDGLIAETGFYRMISWKGPLGPSGGAPPRSADLVSLCGVFQKLWPLAPALRLAVADSARAGLVAATNGVSGGAGGGNAVGATASFGEHAFVEQ